MFEDIIEIESGGILPTRWLREAVNDDVIYSKRFKIPETSFQPASLDLRLGEKAHRLRCSFLPDASMVLDKLPALAMEEIDLRRRNSREKPAVPYPRWLKNSGYQMASELRQIQRALRGDWTFSLG